MNVIFNSGWIRQPTFLKNKLYGCSIGFLGMDGSGQSLERRYHLNIWIETEYWVQDRYTTLLAMDRKVDANCVVLEFKLSDKI
jgi:hypothetical protein